MCSWVEVMDCPDLGPGTSLKEILNPDILSYCVFIWVICMSEVWRIQPVFAVLDLAFQFDMDLGPNVHSSKAHLLVVRH